MRQFLLKSATVAGLLSFYVTAGIAQDTATSEDAAQAASPEAPKVEAQNFRDWRVECYDPAINGLKCQMVQQLQHNQLNKNVMVVTLAYSPAEQKDVMQFVLPLDFLLKPGVGIEISDYRITAAVDRCAPEGCFIEGFAEEKMVAAMRRTTQKGQITMIARTGQRVLIPFSLAGFTRAYNFAKDANEKYAASQAINAQ